MMCCTFLSQKIARYIRYQPKCPPRVLVARIALVAESSILPYMYVYFWTWVVWLLRQFAFALRQFLSARRLWKNKQSGRAMSLLVIGLGDDRWKAFDAFYGAGEHGRRVKRAPCMPLKWCSENYVADFGRKEQLNSSNLLELMDE